MVVKLVVQPRYWRELRSHQGILATALRLVVTTSTIAYARFVGGSIDIEWDGEGEGEYEGRHIYIVRHGDLYKSYAECNGKGGKDDRGNPCYDEPLMKNNAPLTRCGIAQARLTAEWLGDKNITKIVVSPFTRALQTALPLAETIGVKLDVEHLLSEAIEEEGPFREFNLMQPSVTVNNLESIQELWALDYGSPPLKTPESNGMYVRRVKQLAPLINSRFPVYHGNIAVYTHATPAFSLAYGLCYGDAGGDTKLEEFVGKQDPIAPGGLIEVIQHADGTCKEVKQTNNVAGELGCGLTKPAKCHIFDYPGWYWSHSKGVGPANCW
eukprot:TRINITY_DN46363_c0_g1_i1.p1 TRINITY_DN46363_c0_g1~~TRINITY_DN46363_c0_g1_i1.p1  ORF type:complete len:325 (-),score=26.41 TRINITY_DN46363_c0_g1_i1:152-1126(-)